MLESRPLDPAAETLLSAASATMEKVGFYTLGFYTLLPLFCLGWTNPNPGTLGFFFLFHLYWIKIKNENFFSHVFFS
jgi:hypothetical protein